MQPRPPCIPEAQDELERAIMLLGHAARDDLRSGPEAELRALVGAYPNRDQAQIWKSALKKIRKARLKAAAGPPPSPPPSSWRPRVPGASRVIFGLVDRNWLPLQLP